MVPKVTCEMTFGTIGNTFSATHSAYVFAVSAARLRVDTSPSVLPGDPPSRRASGRFPALTGFRRYLAAWMVFIAGLGLTGAAFAWTRSWITGAARHRFESEAQNVRGDLDTYFERLAGTLLLLRERAFGGPDLKAGDWYRHMRSINFESDFPAVSLCAFAELVWPEDREAHELRWKAQYEGQYKIKPDLPATARNPAFHELTNCVMPLVLGDLGLPGPNPISISDFLGRDLLAIGTNGQFDSSLAHRVRGSMGDLPRSFAMQALMPAYHPVEERGIPIGIPVKWKNPPLRNDDRRGAIIAVVNVRRWIAGGFDKRPPDFGMRIGLGFQNTDIVLPAFDSPDLWPQTAPPASPWMRSRTDIALYQSRLHFDFWTTPEFDRNNHRHAPWLVAAAGLAFTVLMSGFVVVQVRARLKEEAISTGLRVAQRELEANRGLLQRVLDNDPAKIYVRDESGRMLVANRAIAAIYGSSPGQIIAANDRMVAANTYPPGVRETLDRDFEVMRSGEPVITEESHIMPDGRNLWFLAVRVPIRGPDGTLQVLVISTDITRLKVGEQSLKASQAKLEMALKERARISRDLHDSTMQELYALGLELGQTRSWIAREPARAEAELARSLTALQAVLTELRQYVLELEPESWQGKSIRAALENLVVRLRRATPVVFHLDLADDADSLPARAAIHVLQLVREGLSNVLRHSEATTVWIGLARHASDDATPVQWTLQIRDDGRGFVVSEKMTGPGRGLRSFRERAAELDGTCEIHTVEGAGTRVVIRFPEPSTA